MEEDSEAVPVIRSLHRLAASLALRSSMLYERAAAGDQLMVFFENEALVGWYLPDKQLGLDLRDPGDTA